jgi:hypothetical protein
MSGGSRCDKGVEAWVTLILRTCLCENYTRVVESFVEREGNCAMYSNNATMRLPPLPPLRNLAIYPIDLWVLGSRLHFGREPT